MTRSKARARVRVLAAIWSLGTVVALWMPPPPQPDIDWPWLDEIVHFGLFGGAAGLWSLAGVRLRALAIGVVVGAALTELGQGLLPWVRHPDLADVASDVAGAALGALCAVALRMLARRDEHTGASPHAATPPGAPEASWRNGRDSNPR